MRNEHVALLLDELKRYGIKGQVGERGKHLEVAWETALGHRFVVCAKTPSDWRGGMNARSELRKLLRADGLSPKPAELSFQRAMSLPEKPLFTPAEKEKNLHNDVEALTDMVFELQAQLDNMRDVVREVIREQLSALTVVSKVSLGEQPGAVEQLFSMKSEPALAELKTKQQMIAELLSYQFSPVSSIIEQAKDITTAASVRSTLQRLRREGIAENGLRGMWRLKAKQ